MIKEKQNGSQRMSMTPDRDIAQSGDVLPVPDAPIPNNLPTTDAYKHLFYRVPPRPIRLRHLIDMEEISLITTIPSLERAPILKSVLASEKTRAVTRGEEHEQVALPASQVEAKREENAVASNPLQASKKKGLSKQLMFVLRVGITLVLIVLILKGISWSEVASTYAHAHLTDLLVGLGLGTLGVVFSTYLWHRLVRAENIRADMAHLTRLYLIGVAFSNFLPTSMGGDALKAYYVGRDSGNMAGSASAVLLSRITGFMGMMLLSIPVVIVLHNSFDGQLVQRFLLLCLLFLASFGCAFIVGAFLPKIQGKYLKGAWARNKIVLKMFETGITLTQSLRRPRALAEAIGFGFLFWVTNSLNYYEYAIALGVHTPFRFYLLAVPFIGIVGALPISISGYGVREGLVEYLYSTIHVPSSIALSVVLLMDIQRIFFSLLGGLLFLMMENSAKSARSVKPIKLATAAS
jgi:uncharacterized protein (TIRG00374 family)